MCHPHITSAAKLQTENSTKPPDVTAARLSRVSRGCSVVCRVTRDRVTDGRGDQMMVWPTGRLPVGCDDNTMSTISLAKTNIEHLCIFLMRRSANMTELYNLEVKLP